MVWHYICIFSNTLSFPNLITKLKHGFLLHEIMTVLANILPFLKLTKKSKAMICSCFVSFYKINDSLWIQIRWNIKKYSIFVLNSQIRVWFNTFIVLCPFCGPDFLNAFFQFIYFALHFPNIRCFSSAHLLNLMVCLKCLTARFLFIWSRSADCSFSCFQMIYHLWRCHFQEIWGTAEKLLLYECSACCFNEQWPISLKCCLTVWPAVWPCFFKALLFKHLSFFCHSVILTFVPLLLHEQGF